ncbi:MAG: glycosyltransferase [Chitinophagaceae bacterium]|nr:glycosyltransferase [Chitinophagaceae bacterium]
MGQSSEIVEYVKKHGASDVYLFRNGVDPERFNIDSVKKKRESTQPLRIIYAGLLGFAQGILDICKNVNFSNLGVEFHIYGAGGEQKALEEYLAKSGDNSIVYHGSVSRDEIPKILLEYDITLIPLVTNIFGAVPSKIYESMAAGLPILFSGEGEGKKIGLGVWREGLQGTGKKH